ncbi:MAG: phosphatase [Mobiluncus sp.]|uniref:Ppx/GppA phosphatase family protein n=1 Tax=Mobiluncus sp. TaxID=47293 RepID=UPI00258A8BC8|nr:phosphatase [Mobiluncus sp.]MCI6584987.1 phosphatase [Mobiluncus sp.]
MRLAAIDCGTHSIRLLISDYDPANPDSRPTDIVRLTQIVGLGQGVDKTGELAPDALARTFAALEEYAAYIREAGCDRIRMVATSASRDATNFFEFSTGVEARLGITPEVISGHEEATLGFRGTLSAHPNLASPVLVVDIGGGSTEFSFGTVGVAGASGSDLPCGSGDSARANSEFGTVAPPADKRGSKESGEYPYEAAPEPNASPTSIQPRRARETNPAHLPDSAKISGTPLLNPHDLQRPRLKAAISMNMGSTRVTERYLRPSENAAGVPSRDAFHEARSFVDGLISEAARTVPLAEARELVGVAGSVTTLTALGLGLDKYDPARINGAVLSSSKLRKLARDLIMMPREEKAALGPMHPKRVDQIAGGVLVWERILAYLEENPGPDSSGKARRDFPVRTSENDILDGIILALAD